MDEISFLVVNSKKLHAQLMIGHLHQRVSFPVYQARYENDIWSQLDGAKDDIIVYDRCGKLVKHLKMPYSYLGYGHVESAIVSAYYENPCGRCEVIEPLVEDDLVMYEVNSSVEGSGDISDGDPLVYLIELEHEVEELDRQALKRQQARNHSQIDPTQQTNVSDGSQMESEDDHHNEESTESKSDSASSEETTEDGSRQESGSSEKKKKDKDWWKVERWSSEERRGKEEFDDKKSKDSDSLEATRKDWSSEKDEDLLEKEKKDDWSTESDEDRTPDDDWRKVKSWSEEESRKQDRSGDKDKDSRERGPNNTKISKSSSSEKEDEDLLLEHQHHNDEFSSER